MPPCLSLCRLLFVSLALLLPSWQAAAQPAVGLPAQSPLVLGGVEVLNTSGHLDWLVDAQGALDAVQASQAAGWAPLPGHLSAGYTDDVVWLRLRLRLQAPGQGQWMLQVTNAVLDDVRMFVQAPGEVGWHFAGASGERVPRRLWPVDFRSPALQLDLAQAGEHTVLLRLASRNAMKTRLFVWQRLAFDNHTRREGLLFGLYFGFYTLLICLHVFFWRATLAPLSGLFLAYVATCVLNELASLGLVQQVTGLGAPWSDRLLGISIAAAFPIAMRMACAQMALDRRMPRMARALLLSSTVLCAAGAALIALDHYGLGITPIQLLGLAYMLVLLASALWLLRQGHAPARAFLLVFGIFHFSVFVAFLRNFGVLPVNVFTEHVSAVGTMAHMVLLSFWMIGGYVRQHRQREREQAYLEAELAQSQQREDTLAQALDLERRMRQEQRDFVTMVSHEFRTPLAVIDSSAQQLARNAAAPPEKTLARAHNIRQAARRLLALVDDCLAADRMAEPHLVEMRRAPCDLHALVDELVQDFPAGRIHCAHGADTRRIATDGALLRIALRNLLANADRHAPAGSPVQLRSRSERGRLHIEVANAAPLIPPEDQRQMFERYYRGRGTRHQPGVGLGLYLVRCIADKLGGSVSLLTAGGDEPVCLGLSLPARG